MALKLLKIQITLEIKADNSDENEVRERVYEELQVLLENEDLTYTVDQDEDEEVEDE